MNLYILKPVEHWVPWYDKCFGVIVRADTERKARELASEQHGDEGPEVWLNSEKTTCEYLMAEGEQEVIMINFAAA